MSKKNILFITPVVPSLKGRGRHFRAFQWVWHLQKSWSVTVLCTSVYGKDHFLDEESLRKLDCSIYYLNHKYSIPQRFLNLLSMRPSAWNSIGKKVEDTVIDKRITRPDIILCFRILNAPVALHLKRIWNTAEMWLDIDEIDSRVRFDISNLMFSDRHYLRAIKERIEGSFYAIQESRLITQFDTVYASTMDEKSQLDAMDFAITTKVMQNRLPFSDNGVPQHLPENPYTFLFVGDSSYYPNLDAINRIVFEIIPGLKNIAKSPFRFILIGGDVGEERRKVFEKEDSILFFRDVENLNSVYEIVDAVVVPLRVGGGSSLKFLEALSHKKPVITTPVGARGYAVENGQQVLIAEQTKEFITHCYQLMLNSSLNNKLSQNGHRWYVENHSYIVD